MPLALAPMTARIASVGVLLFGLLSPAFAQRPPNHGGSDIPSVQSNPITVNICVRDARGMPLEFAAFVRFHSLISSFDVKSATGESSTASFRYVPPGEYEVEVRAMGYQTTTESVSVVSFGGDFSVYVYLQDEKSESTANVPPKRVVMAPKLQNEIEKGLAALQKKDYTAARTYFIKASQMAPGNPDVLYLLGTAELALKNTSAARACFENSLKIEPSNQKALLALGEVDLKTGDISSSIAILEKAFDLNGADWHIHYLLASSYARAERLPEAETHALRGVDLAKEKPAVVEIMYLLGEIQLAEHKTAEAQETWKRILVDFPNDPVVQKTKSKLESLAQARTPSLSEQSAAAIANLPLPEVTPAGLISGDERPWAPPDIDSKEYRVANNTSCTIGEVLARAELRLNSQLMNFEKFAATERIEHQEVNRYGVPGPIRSKEFSYIVFVRKVQPNSVYLDESRLAADDSDAFPTSLATIGLNSLGVSVLQAASDDNYVYRCEGLTSWRGQATWQIRFQERKGADSSTRQWKKNGQIVNVPLKGRFWLTASNYDLLRIETDLLDPLPQLELSMDHLIVDYGPVKFDSGNTKLWLPWSAEMFMQLHGRRYHHKHYLKNYLLFSVDSNHKIAPPKDSAAISNQPSDGIEAAP
jgi:tetratricopeptide (TPR) repeat protein